MTTLLSQYWGTRLGYKHSLAFTRVPACTRVSLNAYMGAIKAVTGGWVPLLHLDIHVIRDSSSQ